MVVTRRLQIAAAAAVCLAGADLSGALVARGDHRSLSALVALLIGALLVVAVEAPLLVLALLVLMLGLVSETPVDNVVPGSSALWQSGVHGYGAPAALVFVLAAAGSLTWARRAGLLGGFRLWPGAPATGFHQASAGTRVAAPVVLLVVALLVGYWLTLAFGAPLLLRWLVAASVLLLPQGLYNGLVARQLSYYDTSPILLIGVAAILVAFRVVDLRGWRLPYLVAAVLVIVVSLRRGAWLALLVALVVTGLKSRRSGFRAALALGALAIVALELAHPGSAFSTLERAVKYTTGGEGREFSTTYRRQETANAWLNVEHHWLGGIGPASDWTLYDSYDGAFRPYGFTYLHNSYLWVWLRFGLAGLVAFVGFLGTSAWTLMRGRRAPLASVAIGAAIAGSGIALYTASFLTTTARWPLTVGLLVGVGLGARARAQGAAADGRPEAREPAKTRRPGLRPALTR